MHLLCDPVRPFPHGGQPLADPAAGDGGRRDRHRPDADHPHGGHRPVVRHGDGAGRHHHEQVRDRARAAGAGGHSLRHRRDHAVRPGQRPLGHAHQAAALHRDLGHAEHRLRDHAAVFVLADRHRPARRPHGPGHHLCRRRRRGGLGRGADAGALCARVVRVARDGRGAAYLRGGKQRRSHAPGGHSHAARAAGRLRGGGRALRHCLAAVGGAHRRGRPERGADREPRRHHGGGARRHQPVRRPRRGAGLADRRADRGRVPQRAHADGRVLDLPGAGDGRARDFGGGGRPAVAPGAR